jgi:hypothetical protein
VPTKSLLELGPQDLVVVSESCGVVHPLGIGRPTKLLGRVQSLLILFAFQEFKLGLDDAKQAIRLQRI